jgi:large subunit ribosomal protein L21
MYAIVEIAGQQFKVQQGKKIFVHPIEAAEGDKVEFEKVLLVDNDGEISIGEPVVANTVVEGQVVAHVRGDKVIIFKKKRRKGYQKRTGHRQDFTQVEILSIGPKGAPAKKSAPKIVREEVAVPAAGEVKEEVKTVKAKKTTAKKTPAEKKTATKAETTEKKTAVKKAPAAKGTKKPEK